MRSERWPQAVMAPEPNSGSLESIAQAVVDPDGSVWDKRVDEIVSKYTNVIALRGAGSNNGIDKEAADRLLRENLIPRIRSYLDKDKGAVAIMYDGDSDNPDKPDIGYIMGRLRDAFSQEPKDKLAFVAAQKKGWYYPPTPGGNLRNANNLEYETYVFADGQFPGDHNRFTQSEKLVNFEGYEQWYIGASGMISGQQLKDYDSKVAKGCRKNVTVFRALLNSALDADISTKLQSASDLNEIEKLRRVQEQRAKKFGVHWDNAGESTIDPEKDFDQRDSQEYRTVVLWEADGKVNVVECRVLDLNSKEVDELFKGAEFYVKTQSVQARQVPVGQSETVVVRSGATRDTAHDGDWIVKSPGTAEEYVVHKADFTRLYNEKQDEPGIFTPARDPRRAIKIDENILFMAPWGQEQAIRSGGWLLERQSSDGTSKERYGVPAEVFLADYTKA